VLLLAGYLSRANSKQQKPIVFKSIRVSHRYGWIESQFLLRVFVLRLQYDMYAYQASGFAMRVVSAILPFKPDSTEGPTFTDARRELYSNTWHFSHQSRNHSVIL
jgi:hypothetical protein